MEFKRRQQRWTQTELAFYSRITQGEVSRFERRKAIPSPRHAERIGRALGVPPATLLEEVVGDAATCA